MKLLSLFSAVLLLSNVGKKAVVDAKDYMGVGSIIGSFYDDENNDEISHAKKSECTRSLVQECTCFELLQINHFREKKQGINVGDTKKGFRKASMFYHPDKGGKAEEFQLVQACVAKLSKLDFVEEYSIHVDKLQSRMVAENWEETKFRDRIDQLNEMLINESFNHRGPQQESPHRPPEMRNDPDIDRLFLFLDDSLSMSEDGALPLGHSALESMADRLDRTPTSVHLIGTQSHLKFGFDDSPSIHDILSTWNANGGRTQLWEYIFATLSNEKRPLAFKKKDEAVIITDGMDNQSRGSFSGIEGYNHLMTKLKQEGVKLRISALCIGQEEMCKSADYRDLSMATGGVYATVDPSGSERKQRRSKAKFANHLTASDFERERLEVKARIGYEQACIAGTAKELTWYTKLSDEEKLETINRVKASKTFETFDL